LPVEEIYLAPEDPQYEDIQMNPLAPEDPRYEDIQMNPLAPEDPQYEHISDALMKLPGEFTVTPCPAYMPTTRSAAPLEAEYEPAGGSVQGQGSLAPVGVGPDDRQQAHQRSDYENVSAPVDVVQLNPLAPVESGPHLYEDIDAPDQNHMSAGGLVQDHCSNNRQHSSVYSNAPNEDEKPKDTTKSECEPVNAPGPAVEDQSSDYVIMDATDSDEKLEDTDSGGPAEDEGSLCNQQQESQ
jgi:hypothetical protein